MCIRDRPLRGICYGEEGFRHFFFRDEVTDINSLKDMKIRVSEDPVIFINFGKKQEKKSLKLKSCMIMHF